MEANHIVSIIVPVYNVEKYIQSCINSILSQSFRDFELILIDDGSMDKSGCICDEYEQVDDRVKVYHTINKGVSAARNLGIDKSTGEWLFFVDADDLVPSNALFELISSIKESTDIVISNCKIETSKNSISIINDNNKKFDVKDINSELYTLNLIKRLNMALWGKLYKKKLFENIRLPENISYYEDYTTLWKIAKRTTSYNSINTVGYIARYRSDSASRRNIDILTFKKRIESLLYASQQIHLLFNDYKQITKLLSKFIISESLGNKILYNDSLHTDDRQVSLLTNKLWSAIKLYCYIPWYLRLPLSVRTRIITHNQFYDFPLWLYYLIRLILKISYNS